MYETDEPMFALFCLALVLVVVVFMWGVMSINEPSPNPDERCWMMRVAAVESVKFERVECP